jgi:HIRAN domain
MDTVIVGTKHQGRSAFEMLGKLREGNELRLKREPRNSYDAYAVAVEFLGQKLGYIPRQANPTIAQEMDKGALAVARVIEPATIKNGFIVREPRIRVELQMPDTGRR